jgi:formate hydrogenlyase subunit 3/multisubunit Na+/H+ antiporter MnhD subunit
MIKPLVEIINLIALAVIAGFPFLGTKGRGIAVLAAITSQVVIGAIVSITVFINGAIEYTYQGSVITGAIPVRIDYLSAWFIIIIGFTFLTGSWYGIQYMKKYIAQTDNLALHGIALLLVHTALIDICILQNGLALIVIWEIMALSSFIIIIFEHYKTETLKAGINFLIQSHVCILFLTVAFMWVKVKTGSFDFQAITTFSSMQPPIIGIGLFVIFFFGFAIKAGFVPFHTWLPLAHPAAPSHISGIMSGVIIKIGIYGILRMLLLIKTDMVALGYFLLIISVITGIYGVMLAIVQHNLKKLLAYHSIENIGIIGIGIGLGTLGLGYNNQMFVIAGFGGALLHTLNHSLFKSLLFFSAGNVYQESQTMNIESLGGMLKYIPRTGYLFLIGSIAICGLPPFNGFVSEFFIYKGLFQGMVSNNFMLLLSLLFSIFGLVIIGGLAMLCFTKAFGTVFLGQLRDKSIVIAPNDSPYKIIPLYCIVVAIVFIGVFPILLQPALTRIIYLYQPLNNDTLHQINTSFSVTTVIGWYSLAFIVMILIFYFLRKLVTAKRINAIDNTWGCGYTGNADKMQYTASSFVRNYRKLTEPILMIKQEKKEAVGLYPKAMAQHTHAEDKIENWFIDKPLYLIRRVLSSFTFLQNGNIQAYILYGFIFITLIILLPLLINKISILINFLNQL